MQNKFTNFYNGLSKKSKEIINTIFVLFMLLPHFQASFLNQNGTILDTIYNIARVISALIMLFLYIRNIVKMKYFSKVYLIYFILQSYIFINSTIQSGFNRDFFIDYISSIILLMIIDYFSHKTPEELIHALLILFEILLLVNFIIMLIYPKGIPTTIRGSGLDYHFLGNRNSLVVYIILALTFALLHGKWTGKLLDFYILLPICIATSIIGKSTTGFLSLFLFLFLYYTRIYNFKHTTLSLSMVIYIVLVILVVFVRIQDYLTPIWELFGKNSTLTRRTDIWDKILPFIAEKPIFGYGRLKDEIMVSLCGPATIHNCFLEHLFRGGIVQLVIISTFIIFTILSIKPVRFEQTTHYIILGIIALLLHTLVESAQGPIYYILFIILAHSHSIADSLKLKEEKISLDTTK